MKSRSLIMGLSIVLCLFIFATTAFSSTSANIATMEEDLHNGWWKYDITVSNTSDAGESLYMFLLDFGQQPEPVTIQSGVLPDTWFGVVWEGQHEATFVHAMSINPATYLGADDTQTDFSFQANTQLGEVSYHAEFINASSINGTTINTVAPEPVSTVLFLTGGATMAFRYRQKRKSQSG